MAPKRITLARALDRLGLLRALLAARSRAIFPWRHLSVVTFHRVASPGAPGFDPDVADTTPVAFARQVEILKRYFTLVDTLDLQAHRSGVPLPDNPAMITFDDGYRDNHDEALPILKRLDAKAVFFVSTGHVADRRLFWWEKINNLVLRSPCARLTLSYPEAIELDTSDMEGRRRAIGCLLRIVKEREGLDLDRFLAEVESATGVTLGRDEERELADQLIMDWDHVRALKAAGMDVQSHTRSHRILNTLSDAEARADLTAARQDLEAALETPVQAVAYPAGKSLGKRPGLRRAVHDAGYRLGFTCGTGAARVGKPMDWLEVPRVALDRDMPDAFFRGCLAIPSLAY